jgi:4'-phosphopantetheinyl transferase
VSGSCEPGPSRGGLHPEEVVVYRAPFDARSAPPLEPLLSRDEAARAARLAFPRERARFVFSRGRLRLLLAGLGGGDPAELRIEADPDGKPRLGGECGQGRIRFSVSHSGPVWACAVALHREVGLDVEEVREERDADRLAERYFSPAETAAIRALPDRERRAAFHRGWTRKEAYLKARGLGITVPLDSFEVEVRPGEPARLLATRPDPEDAARWTLHDLGFGPGFAAALCVEGTVRAVRVV